METIYLIYFFCSHVTCWQVLIFDIFKECEIVFIFNKKWCIETIGKIWNIVKYWYNHCIDLARITTFLCLPPGFRNKIIWFHSHITYIKGSVWYARWTGKQNSGEYEAWGLRGFAAFIATRLDKIIWRVNVD